MDDSIFDDVDAILSEDISNDDDKNFNDSELQDIMSEIENLEKEFDSTEDSDTESQMSLQEKIDAELAMELEAAGMSMSEDNIDDNEPENVASVIKSQTIPFEKPVSSQIPKGSEVSFAAHGQMSFNLDFKVGSETAKLVVDPVKGLMISVAGVEFCINENSGCTVSMENGMKFTIPLSSQANNSVKKKAA
jgi:hypothetical protein